MSFDKYFEEARVPEELRASAEASLSKGKSQARKATPYKALAPIVMFIALFLCWGISFKGGRIRFVPWIKWEDDHLPKILRRWDNNISMNGDAWGMILPDGSMTYKYDRAHIDEFGGTLKAIQYTDPAYTGTAYYAKKSHPRSRWARYIWLGWRNKASLYAMELGELVDPNQEVSKFGITPTKGFRTVQLLKSGDVWQLRVQGPVFGGYFDHGRNIGFKINNATATHPRASATYGSTLRRIKKGDKGKTDYDQD